MNDFFKYFEKLNPIFKTTIISIAVFIPFWYISIYVINQKLFLNLDLSLRIAFCFCFSTALYICQLLFLIIDMSIKKIEDYDGRFSLAGVLGIFFLCVSIIIHYQTNISYKLFLYQTFIYIISFNAIVILVDYFGDKIIKRKKHKKL